MVILVKMPRKKLYLDLIDVYKNVKQIGLYLS